MNTPLNEPPPEQLVEELRTLLFLLYKDIRIVSNEMMSPEGRLAHARDALRSLNNLKEQRGVEL